MASPYYGPDDDQGKILLEQNFLVGGIISGIGFGIQLVLYVSCALYWRQRRERRYAIFLLAYITTLICVELVFLAVQTETALVLYIDNRNYPGEPWAYFLATQNLAINVIFYATLFILTFLADCMVVRRAPFRVCLHPGIDANGHPFLWRCWVIWASAGSKLSAYVVISFPTAVMVASFVMGNLWKMQSSQPGLSLYSALPLAYGTSFYHDAVSLGLNIILTFLILGCLLYHRRYIMKCLPEEFASHYLSLAAIIVESAALYSVFAFLFLITSAVNNPSNQTLLGFASTAQQVSLYLIIYRVAEGHAWGTRTIPQQTLTEIRFESHDIEASTTSLQVVGTLKIVTPTQSRTFEAKSYDEEPQ